MFDENPLALPSFVLGYHGCDHELAEEVLSGNLELSPSSNSYDWLGHGIYFWEHNPSRAVEWAGELKHVKTPAVIGAIINLGRCFNLLDSSKIKNLGGDLLLRVLDCEVINHAMKLADMESKSFDTP